jgi:hypothetical protein
VLVGALLVGAGLAVGAAAYFGTESTDGAAPRTDRLAAATLPTTTPTAPLVTAPSRPCRAPLTPEAPLRLWIAGDSHAWSVGNGLGKRAAATGVVAPVYESQVGSGLASPGYFNWPKRIAEELPRLDPEIVVFVMGTNDWLVPQPKPVDADGRPAWKAEYAQRVEAVVERLAGDDRTLFWIGPPVLRDPAQEEGAKAVAEVIARVVGQHPGAVFVDAHALFADERGAFTPWADVGGRRIQARDGDGVHLTPEGGEYLGDVVFAAIDAQCRVKAQAVAGRRQPLVETKGSTTVPPGSVAPTVAPPTSLGSATTIATTSTSTTTTSSSTTTTTTSPPGT